MILTSIILVWILNKEELRELQVESVVCSLEVLSKKPAKEIVQVLVEATRAEMQHGQTSPPYVLLFDAASQTHNRPMVSKNK